MYIYWFQHYRQGRMIDIHVIRAKTISEAVIQLSEKYKGVFKLFARGMKDG